MPGFLYTVFGTIKEVTIGPTAVNALISYNYAGPSAARALTLAFWTGLIQISLAFFQMGKFDSPMESGRSESDMRVSCVNPETLVRSSDFAGTISLPFEVIEAFFEA